MTLLFVDASVWLASLNMKEAHHSKVRTFFTKTLSEGAAFGIPDLCLLECVVSLARSGVPVKEALKVEPKIRAIVERVVPLAEVLSQAIEIGAKLRLRGADAIYAACAKQDNALLVTLDREVIDRCSWARSPESL